MDKTICCYGDSNTYGYDPRSPFGERYEACWCDLLRGYEVQNLGMNGRTIPGSAWELEEVLGKKPALLLVMLGTNDLLTDCSVLETAGRMERFLTVIRDSWPEQKILLVSPPKIRIPGFENAAGELAERYALIARKLCCDFADSAAWNLSMAADGVHFSQEGHRQMAGMLQKIIRL